MLLVDTNILLYAANEDAEQHAACLDFLETQRREPSPWYTTWPILYEFLRVITHHRVLERPWSTARASAFVSPASRRHQRPFGSLNLMYHLLPRFMTLPIVASPSSLWFLVGLADAGAAAATSERRSEWSRPRPPLWPRHLDPGRATPAPGGAAWELELLDEPP